MSIKKLLQVKQEMLVECNKEIDVELERLNSKFKTDSVCVYISEAGNLKVNLKLNDNMYNRELEFEINSNTKPFTKDLDTLLHIIKDLEV